MKLYLFIHFCVIVEIYGCWSKSKPAPATTTTTTARSPIEEEIQAVNTAGSNAASAGGRSGGGGQKKWKVDNAELRSLSEELYRLDTNSVGNEVQLNLQGKTSPNVNSDAAPQPLITSVNHNALKASTYRTFLALLDNYVPDVKKVEDNTGPERSEVNNFLNAVAASKVMKKTEEFLNSKGLLRGPLREQLQVIWFTPYTRSRNVVGSSGFEHVFLGEIKDGKVSGFHNWLFFEKEEKENDLNYKGYLTTKDLGNTGEIVKITFDWMNRKKPVGSMFVGTSPELEMALYTVCFYARPNAGCNLQMNKQRFRIKVYKQTYEGKSLIGSAYPEVY